MLFLVRRSLFFRTIIQVFWSGSYQALTIDLLIPNKSSQVIFCQVTRIILFSSLTFETR